MSVLDAGQNQDVYTIFPPRIRGMIVGILGVAMLTSPLAATIYFPLLPVLARHFSTTTQAINLTITVYVIFQALSPLLLAGVSDHCGRRPIYLATFSLFTIASLGLALNRSNYAALVALRALQSVGASSVLSVSYGTLADITIPATRGKTMGPMLAVANLGTSVGPIIGGWIVLASGDFVWAFWTLFIFGAVLLLALATILPETARNVVGNGSIEEKRWNQPLWQLFHKFRHSNNSANDNTTSEPLRRFKFTSPLASIRVIFYRDTSLELWILSSFYAMWYCVQTTIPHTFTGAPYRFTELEVGLAYLPGSVGVILSMYLVGKYLDRNYKRSATKLGRTIDKTKEQDLYDFPIEQARSVGCAYVLALSTSAITGYGWAIGQGTHVAVPLILQFFLGFLATWLIQCYSILLVDTFPKTPSTAATAGNVMRCVLSAITVAILQPLIDAIGKAWFFTLIGLLTGFGGLASHVALNRWGMRWRQHRYHVD